MCILLSSVLFKNKFIQTYFFKPQGIHDLLKHGHLGFMVQIILVKEEKNNAFQLAQYIKVLFRQIKLPLGIFILKELLKALISSTLFNSGSNFNLHQSLLVINSYFFSLFFFAFFFHLNPRRCTRSLLIVSVYALDSSDKSAI